LLLPPFGGAADASSETVSAAVAMSASKKNRLICRPPEKDSHNPIEA
jgi:hypothetical protein